MYTVACSSKLPIKTPRIVRKARRIQNKRDVQMKTLVNDISSIAAQEVDRLRDLTMDMLDNPGDNPIIIKDDAGEEPQDE